VLHHATEEIEAGLLVNASQQGFLYQFSLPFSGVVGDEEIGRIFPWNRPKP
jgi:hypothetical protein